MFRRAILSCLLAASVAGCATSNAVPRPFPSPDWKKPGKPPASGPVPRQPSSPSAPDAPGAAAAEPAPPTAVPPATSTPGSLTSRRFDGRAVADFALGFRGVPYRPGGSDPRGFDCSGLVQYVFAQYGVAVPRLVERQYEAGHNVKKPTDIRPGDLLFFETQGGGATHVAIALGGSRFVHAPSSTGVVRVEALTSTYWGSRYLGARRVSPDDSDD